MLCKIRTSPFPASFAQHIITRITNLARLHRVLRTSTEGNWEWLLVPYLGPSHFILFSVNTVIVHCLISRVEW